MCVASALSRLVSVKHPSLSIMCREDGAVLIRQRGGDKNNPTYSYTFGTTNVDGYKRVWINGENYAVHRLIAEAFLPVDPKRTFVDHINRIRGDNRVSNLRWVTFKENIDNSTRVIERDTRVSVRCCDDKKTYGRLAWRLQLSIVNQEGRHRSTAMLPKDVYDKLKPMTQRERYYAYMEWREKTSLDKFIRDNMK